jgi:hypothetical protein
MFRAEIWNGVCRERHLGDVAVEICSGVFWERQLGDVKSIMMERCFVRETAG